MSSINMYIKENVKQVAEKEKNVFIAPDIPDNKLNNAIKAFKCEDFYESILAIYDDSMFNNAKCGLVFTGEKVIHNSYGTFMYADIESVEHVVNITINDKGKENKEEFILIKTKDGENHNLKHDLAYANKNYLAMFLNKIINEFVDFKEENQLKTIAEMPEELKIAYMKVIVNMTFIDDGEIDKEEIAEIFLLMTRLELETDSRFIIRTYISDAAQDTLEEVKKLVDDISKHADSSHYKSIMISLAKDLINVYFSVKLTKDRDFEFLNTNKELLELTDGEIELAYDAVENDRKIITDDLEDKVIAEKIDELGKKAFSVGAPLGAVYLSGSVLGLSAAGMTSGLATLGMGGVLGLSSMATGIGVAVLIGVGVYKGMQHLTGANKLDKYKAKASFLEGIIKQNQKTVSLIMEDINHIVDKLNTVMLKQSEIEDTNTNLKTILSKKIIDNKKLLNMLGKFTGAADVMNKNTQKYQNSASRLSCPRTLDETRLASLTSEVTKKEYYNLIINNYEEKDNSEGKKELVLKENAETEDLEMIAQTLKALGYFDMDNFLKGKVKGIFG